MQNPLVEVARAMGAIVAAVLAVVLTFLWTRWLYRRSRAALAGTTLSIGRGGIRVVHPHGARFWWRAAAAVTGLWVISFLIGRFVDSLK